MDEELLYRSATARTTAQEEQALADWLARSPEHEQRFRETIDVLRLAADADDELNFGPAPTADDILAARGGRSGVTKGRRGRARLWRAGILLAAATVAGLAIGLPLTQRLTDADPASATSSSAAFGSDEFVTELQPATVGLRDGSVVRLAPDTRLRVHTRQDGREVSLVGRGYFAVAHDPVQPFTVHSDAGTITVLGTRFDLTVTGEDLRLIVIEGSVRLTVRGSQVVVRAGQLAQVLRGNIVPPVDVPDPGSLIGWVGNFIAFHHTPLRTVTDEIEQRYDVQIELSDPELGDRTVTALFAGRTYEEIAEVICVVTHLECTRVGGVLRMAPAR
jgi:transmembrane sensor